MDKVRVFIITQEEPFFIPKLVDQLVKSQNINFNIIGATVLKPYRKNKTIKDWAKERTTIYTWFELSIVTFLILYCKAFNFVTRKGTYSVSKTFESNNVSLITTSDINSNSFLESLKQLKIDAIISISSPQLFQKELINLPNIFCINAHGTLLPKHRGVFGSWWTLFDKDKETGATIHTIDEKIDRGEIIWQKSVQIDRGETQYSIAFKTKKLMAYGIVELLEQVHLGKVKKIDPVYKESYHRAPTKEQGKEFHKRGLKIITPANMKLALKKSF